MASLSAVTSESRSVMESFQDVLKNVKSFLLSHPSEMVILLLKPEDTTFLRTGEDLAVLINDDIEYTGFYDIMFADPTWLPKTLGEARGKAVIIGREIKEN